MMSALLTESPILAAPCVDVEPQEAEARYDALCQAYFGRALHDHAAVRRRTLGVLTDAACMGWPWGCMQYHCGLSTNFLTLVYEGLRDGVDAAMARATEHGRGSWVCGETGSRDPRHTGSPPDDGLARRRHKGDRMTPTHRPLTSKKRKETV